MSSKGTSELLAEKMCVTAEIVQLGHVGERMS